MESNYKSCRYNGKRRRLVAWFNARRMMCKCRFASGYCSPPTLPQGVLEQLPRHGVEQDACNCGD